MSVISFDVTVFRASFPAFLNSAKYPDATLQSFFDTASIYINPETGSGLIGGLNDAAKTRALNLMTAHLAQLSSMIAAGQTPALVQSSSIDKISVSLTPPPAKSHLQWWLSLTGYGAQLLALLQAKTAGGFYIGGTPELASFRKSGGRF